MTNCEDCVYYEYDPEADTNYCEADLDEDEMERFLRSANAPFTAPVTSTGRPGGSKGPDRESRDGGPAFPLAEAEGEAFPLRRRRRNEMGQARISYPIEAFA